MSDELRDRLRAFTEARVFLPRAGVSLTTASLLELRLADARARDAVHQAFDVEGLVEGLGERGVDAVAVRSGASTRAEYLRRPDLGRRLSDASVAALRERRGEYDLVIVIADGLSARATHDSALALLDHLAPALAGRRVAPVVVAEQARVALGDPIARDLGATAVAVLLGERPGSTAADSLGVYYTYAPTESTTDAQRNCLSNIRPGGQSPAEAAHKLAFLVRESFARRLSGVELKENAAAILDAPDGPGLLDD